MDVGAISAAALAAQCEQHTSGEIKAGLYRADYSSSFLPAEAQQELLTQLALLIITIVLFGEFPRELPERWIY